MEKWKEGVIQIAAAIIIFIAVILFNNQIKSLKEWGYIGVFVISALSSATILIPAPGWATVIAMSAFLNPYLLGVVAGVGSGLGETTGYLAGDGITDILIGNKADLEKYLNYVRKYGFAAILVLAFIPNPLFDVAGLAAGSVKMRYWAFLSATITGRILRYIILAYLGAFTLSLI